MPWWNLFATVFGIIFIAELPDKTALAALVLATKHKPLPVFLGAALALTVQSVVAVAAGGLLSMLPEKVVHVGAGVLFLVCAVLMARRGGGDDDEVDAKDDGRPATFGRSFATVFGVVFVAEWGDLTQIGTATLAARYKAPLVVFASSTLALWCVVAIAVAAGNRIGSVLKPKVVSRIAAVVFALLGIALIVGLV